VSSKRQGLTKGKRVGTEHGGDTGCGQGTGRSPLSTSLSDRINVANDFNSHYLRSDFGFPLVDVGEGLFSSPFSNPGKTMLGSSSMPHHRNPPNGPLDTVFSSYQALESSALNAIVSHPQNLNFGANANFTFENRGMPILNTGVDAPLKRFNSISRGLEDEETC
jgi:hypothetical protein